MCVCVCVCMFCVHALASACAFRGVYVCVVSHMLRMPIIKIFHHTVYDFHRHTCANNEKETHTHTNTRAAAKK